MTNISERITQCVFQRKPSRFLRPALGAALLATSTLSAVWAPAPALAQGELFPEPFLVEHHLVRTAADGTVTTTEPVVDTYGGSWIVSQRGDGSRLVIDLARREMTEIRPERGQYSRIGFERLRELQHQLARVADPSATLLAARAARALPEKSRSETNAGDATSPGVEAPRVESLSKQAPSAVPVPVGGADAPEVASNTFKAGRSSLRTAALPEAGAAVRARSTVDRLVVSAPFDADRLAARRRAAGLDAADARKSALPASDREAAGLEQTVEVWVDRSLRLAPGAVDALGDLELQVLGPPPERAAVRPPEPAALVAAARKAADGAFAVYTRRAESARPEDPEAPRQLIEDVVTRLEPLERFPVELVRVPEGYELATHPLEVMAQYVEDDAALRRDMGSDSAADSIDSAFEGGSR